MAVALPCFCHITCVTEALLEDYKTLLALAAGGRVPPAESTASVLCKWGTISAFKGTL